MAAQEALEKELVRVQSDADTALQSLQATSAAELNALKQEHEQELASRLAAQVLSGADQTAAHLHSRAVRRMINSSLGAAWQTWVESYRQRESQIRLLRIAASALYRPKLVRALQRRRLAKSPQAKV